MKLIVERILRVVLIELKPIYPTQQLGSIYSHLVRKLTGQLRIIDHASENHECRIWSDTLLRPDHHYLYRIRLSRRGRLFTLRISKMEDDLVESRLVLMEGNRVTKGDVHETKDKKSAAESLADDLRQRLLSDS